MNPPNLTQVSQWTAWAPVLASLITGSLTILAVVLVQAWTTRREREARERDAIQKENHRWDEFKLKTLVELQDTLGLFATLPIVKVLEISRLDMLDNDKRVG